MAVTPHPRFCNSLVVLLPRQNSNISFEHLLISKDMSYCCLETINQIKDKRYDTYLRNDTLIYGIAFCKKRCKVVVEKL